MHKLISDVGLANVAESIDRLINVDIGARGSAQVLFDASRELLRGKPMTLAAVELMQDSIQPGDYVFITTGWADQPSNIPTKSETDGPPGAAAIARAIRITRKGLPIVVTDGYLAEDMKKIMSSCGFSIVAPENLPNSLSDELGFTMVPTIAVIGMPIDQETCRIRSDELLDCYKPSLCLAIERGGMNKYGRIHGMGGFDFSASQSKMDYLFTNTPERGIASIGIGDGGNEIGMANIEKTVREKIKNGNICKCPCQSGIALDVAKVDVLISAAISNWAGYGIACLLSLAEGNLDAMCSEDIERRVLDACCRVEFHDSIGSRVAPSVDGCAAPIHLAIIRLIREIVDMGMKRFPSEG
jgi:hypothetical protein